MATLVDTNVLVYRHDSRVPEKQRRASDLLRDAIGDGEVLLPHQAIIEFVAATTRPFRGGPLLSPEDARREAEELLTMFAVLYPTEGILRLALRGAAAYQLPWYDAHMWAYAEHYGCDTLWSEDFEHGRAYGTVTTIDPFRA